MRLKQISPEVAYSEESVPLVSREDLIGLVEKAKNSPKNRSRICVHKDENDKHQEMFIALAKGVYIRPHKHANKAESFAVLEGELDVVFFDESGKITNTVKMGDYASGEVFYYRVAEPVYHSLIVRSDYVIYKESTVGPFDRAQTTYAPWAPEESDLLGAALYMKRLGS